LLILSYIKKRIQIELSPFVGFILTLISAIFLVVYNLIFNPKSLVKAFVVIIGVVLFTYIYRKIESNHLSLYLDKDLEEREANKF